MRNWRAGSQGRRLGKGWQRPGDKDCLCLSSLGVPHHLLSSVIFGMLIRKQILLPATRRIPGAKRCCHWWLGRSCPASFYLGHSSSPFRCLAEGISVFGSWLFAKKDGFEHEIPMQGSETALRWVVCWTRTLCRRGSAGKGSHFL